MIKLDLTMSSPPKISLVIPIYNREDYLPAAVKSILAQTYPHFELILWDDQSTDRSLLIAQQYAQQDGRVRVVAALHQGFTRSLDAAFALATGTYLGWVDSDDRLTPTALAETATILDTYAQVGMVYTDYFLMDAQNQRLGLGQRCGISYSKNRLLVEFMTFHFRLMRRSVFELAGGIDPTLELIPDYDLCLRLSEVTEICHLCHPLYEYRVHAESMSHQRQLETIRNSQQAVERALQRRGLADVYELEVHLLQENNEVVSQFALRRKAVHLDVPQELLG
jgi:glycosyltransferase involved in cell wall biosynthesis